MAGGKHILLAAWGGAGEVFPVLGVARELAARGHRAVVAAPSRHAAEAAALGIPFQPLRPALPQSPEARARVARQLLDPARGRRRLWRELLLPGLRDTVQDLQAAGADADLVVAHPDMPAAGMIAAARGLPWISLVVRPAMLASREDPPELPGLGLVRLLPPRWAARLLAPLRQPPDPARRALAALQAELGLPAAAAAPAGVIALFPPAFRPPRGDDPAQLVLAGFARYDGVARRPMPAELADFLDAGAPPIVFTLGCDTVRLAENFFGLAMAAAERLGRRAVMLVGRRAVLGAPPSAGVAVVEFAPHSRLLPRAAAVVHHGGIGSTGQALRAGRPALIVPFGGDQHENARLAAGLAGSGVLPRARLSADRLTAALSTVLADPVAARRAQRAAANLGGDGACCAADAIEAVLHGQPLTTPLRRPRLVHSA